MVGPSHPYCLTFQFGEITVSDNDMVPALQLFDIPEGAKS